MKNKLTSAETEQLLNTLKLRFEKNMHRHKGLKWNDVQTKLLKQAGKLWSLHQMEITGGEPDVVLYNKKENTYVFCDCSIETPKDRRSLCYDQTALNSRKEHKPKNSAINLASEMGIELLDEEQYQFLQSLVTVDTKTSSWIKTPENIRTLGGAIFGDYRFGRVFIYHNGAESYYAARGFRGQITV
jgi:hypothetical protein